MNDRERSMTIFRCGEYSGRLLKFASDLRAWVSEQIAANDQDLLSIEHHLKATIDALDAAHATFKQKYPH